MGSSVMSQALHDWMTKRDWFFVCESGAGVQNYISPVVGPITVREDKHGNVMAVRKVDGFVCDGSIHSSVARAETPQKDFAYRSWLGGKIESITGTLESEDKLKGIWYLDTNSLEKLYRSLTGSDPQSKFISERVTE